jgi:PAS domain-containing protein
MSRIINLNKNSFSRDRLFISLIIISGFCGWVVYGLSSSTGGWISLHAEHPSVVFIELLPVILIGFLLYTTSSRHQETKENEHQTLRKALIHSVANTIGKIKTGEYDRSKDITGEKEIDVALREIYDKFRADADDERNRSWINEGLALFRQIMGTHNEVKAMCDEILSKLVKYVNAAQGGIFITTEDKNLALTSCYAFERKKYLTKTVVPGEGLVGQCYLEGHRIYMTKVPQEYVNITSGLGGANPECILILPLKLKDDILGVLEIASFKPMKTHELDLMERAAEALAQSISAIHINEQTRKLLDQSLGREREMKDQEERMRQSLEELYVTQEEMRKINLEMEELFKAINALTATVELNTRGEIIKLNDRFTNTLNIDAGALYGHELKSFLSAEKDGKESFARLWPSVKNGQPAEKVFSFVDSKQELRWLRTGFYPLQGKDGTERIICFLNDVSEILLKEIELDKLNREVEAFRKMLIRILNEIPLKIFLKQYDGRFFVVNDAVSSFHGFDSPDGLIGKSDFDFYDHKDASEWLAAEHKIIGDGRTEYIHEDGGRILHTVKMPFYIDPLNETGLLGYQADVTELEHLKKRLGSGGSA